MDAGDVERFAAEREELHRRVMRYAGREMKRFFRIDGDVYREGALGAKTKELLGLVASLVLRCDDCVGYHLRRCNEEGVSDAELEEALAVGLVVGGSVTIPQLRRAFRTWEELRSACAGAGGTDDE